MLTLNGLIIALTALGLLLRPSPADVQFSNVGRILDVAQFAMVFGFVLVLLISAVLGLRRAAKGSADSSVKDRQAPSKGLRLSQTRNRCPPNWNFHDVIYAQRP